MFESELRQATAELPEGVMAWLGRALRSGWFPLAHGTYEGDDRARCPIAAAATMAGVWSGGAVAPGNPDWGDPSAPSEAVENFAAYFDLCAEEAGVEAAGAIVEGALGDRAKAAAA